MSVEAPVTLADEVAGTAAATETETGTWMETAVAVVFATTAVLFVSFVAVVTGLT